MRNRFPGTCYRCSKRVKEGEGHFEKIPGVYPTAWRVQHADCCIAHRGIKQAEENLICAALQAWSDGIAMPNDLEKCCAELDEANRKQRKVSHA